MKKIWKKVFIGLLSFIIVISCMKIQASAATPLSLALKLTTDTMKQGDTMHVSAALQNYDEKYTDNVVTTVIVEVSIDTTKLSVDSKSIKVELDEGSGMGFSVGQLKGDSNVELQYLNVGDPLAKGTTDLYSFDITALSDIDNLLDAIKITYAVMQDGTKATSEKLTVVPFVMVNGKAVEQGNVDEKYTSEYGTVEAASEQVSEAMSKADTSSGNTNSSTGSASNGNVSSGNVSGGSNSSDIEESTSKISGTEEVETDSNGNVVTSDEDESRETATVENSSDGKTDDTKVESETKKESVPKDTTENKSGRVVSTIVFVIVIIAAVGGAIYWYIRKRKQTQKDE